MNLDLSGDDRERIQRALDMLATHEANAAEGRGVTEARRVSDLAARLAESWGTRGPLPEPIGTFPARYDVADLSLILDKVDLDLTTHDAGPAAHKLQDLSNRAHELAMRLIVREVSDRSAASSAGAGSSTQWGDRRPAR